MSTDWKNRLKEEAKKASANEKEKFDFLTSASEKCFETKNNTDKNQNGSKGGGSTPAAKPGADKAKQDEKKAP